MHRFVTDGRRSNVLCASHLFVHDWTKYCVRELASCTIFLLRLFFFFLNIFYLFLFGLAFRLLYAAIQFHWRSKEKNAKKRNEKYIYRLECFYFIFVFFVLLHFWDQKERNRDYPVNACGLHFTKWINDDKRHYSIMGCIH